MEYWIGTAKRSSNHACTRVFTLRVSVCHLWMNCSSVGSCECNPERRTHQYPRCQRNADQVCPMWREESSCNHCWHYGSTEHYKARWCKAKTNLRQSALEPENGPGAPVSTHSQIVKGYAHHVLTFVKGYAHHVQWKVVSLIGSHSQRISQYTLIIPWVQEVIEPR